MVRSCLKLNTINSRDMVDGIWEKLWKAKLHPRLKMFMWRALAGVLPTRDVVGSRLGFGDTCCGVCGADQESLFHLFKECPGSSLLAFACKWGFRLEEWRVNSVSEIMEACINPDWRIGGMDQKLASVFISSFLYYVWQFRNNDIYTRGLVFSRKINLLNQAVEDFLHSERSSDDLQRKPNEVWSPPTTGWLKANSDAAFSNGKV